MARILYPPLCLSCQTFLPKDYRTLCLPCFEQLELLDPDRRCDRCFTPLIEEKVCTTCQGHMAPVQTAAAFSYTPALASLMKYFKYYKRSDLADAFASYLFLQIERMGWEKPDLLVPVPMYWIKKMHRCYNPAEVLATVLGQLWSVPTRLLLKRRGGERAQGEKSAKQRKQLTSSSFICRGDLAEGARICIIDDVMTTGATMRCAAESLLVAGAYDVRGLAVCRAGM